VARYRLRFLLQEFDLPPGETILGRSPDCHVTIEDPLVSRQHARVVLQSDQAIVEVLGSRNGVRVNGRPIKGPTTLADGDRLRIGTQELVFCRVSASTDQSSKRTGFLRHCARCRTPYPEEMGTCPNCGASDAADEETLSGMFGESRQNWTLQLLVEVLEKALSLHRDGDAERILRRAASNVDERLTSGGPVDPQQLDGLADCAARLSEVQKTAHWVRWVLTVYASLGLVPRAALFQRLQSLPLPEQAGLTPALDAVWRAAQARGRPLTDEETAGAQCLLAMVRQGGS
jgi:hypothetical protein